VSARAAAPAVALVVLAWVSAGPAPLARALAEAGAPTDFVRDYVTAHARVRRGQVAPPIGEDGNAYAVSIGAPEVVLLGGPYHLHPPPALLPILALVPLGFAGAARAWLALSLVALGALAFGLLSLARPDVRPSPLAILLTFAALVLWPPVLHNLAKGQWSILMAALVTLGFRALERRRPRAAGAWLGAAASLKATPVLLLGYVALRRPRAAATMLAVCALAVGAALLVSGLPPWRDWLGDMPRDVAVWQTWLPNTASLDGLFARLFAGGAFARPLVDAPALARALNAGASLALVGVVVLATHRTATPSRGGDRALAAAWIALVVVLNPLAWTHTAILALPALALLWGLAPPWTLAVALALLSVPRETLAALAGPPPVAPAAAPLLSLHAFALLLIVFTALRCARSAPAPDLERSPAPP
jgi:hypothetical protein